MSDSGVLDKYISRVADDGPRRPSVDTAAAEQDVDDLGCFGWLRGVRERAVMLELRKKDGNVVAVSYGWLERVTFDPSHGITLQVGGQKVHITGRNLNAEVRTNVRLFEGIARHRVSWVREAGRAGDIGAGPDAVVVESVEW